MAIVRWDPYREIMALQDEFNRALRRFGTGGGETAGRESWMPSVDVVETKDALKLKAELAGMKPEDINLEVEDNVLTLSGERRFEEKVEEDKYYRIERRYGTFTRSLALPQNVDADKIEAHYENGILEVTIPKAEEAKPKKIAVGRGDSGSRTVEAETGGGR
ncbi:MAG: Hsp20/alpha crystallin family protein [Thermoleophilia bacterium]